MNKINKQKADNCWAENKNNFIFKWAAWLVKKEIFETVELSFLLEGHTHEDIDQVLYFKMVVFLFFQNNKYLNKNRCLEL